MPSCPVGLVLCQGRTLNWVQYPPFQLQYGVATIKDGRFLCALADLHPWRTGFSFSLISKTPEIADYTLACMLLASGGYEVKLSTDPKLLRCRGTCAKSHGFCFAMLNRIHIPNVFGIPRVRCWICGVCTLLRYSRCCWVLASYRLGFKQSWPVDLTQQSCAILTRDFRGFWLTCRRGLYYVSSKMFVLFATFQTTQIMKKWQDLNLLPYLDEGQTC